MGRHVLGDVREPFLHLECEEPASLHGDAVSSQPQRLCRNSSTEEN